MPFLVVLSTFLKKTGSENFLQLALELFDAHIREALATLASPGGLALAPKTKF